jgi:HlyD family secretion protein
MRRTSITALTLSALLAGAVPAGLPQAAFAETAAPAAPAQTAPAIRVVAAERRELVETLSVTGTIVPRQEAAAGTDLNGMVVTELSADEGDTVKAGQVLATLDRSMLDTQLNQMLATRVQGEASVAQMQAQIGDAKVGVKQADEALTRAKALQQRAVATQAQLDNAENAAESARAKVTSAEKAMAATQAQLAVIDAQIENVRVQISKTQVRAPADGLVLARAATMGGIVSAASGPLFRIAIDAEFELEAKIAETSLPRLTKGMSVEVTLPGADAPLKGKIRRISPEVNQSSRLGAIRIALDANEIARAGSFARGEIELVRREGVAVPASALVYRGSQAMLQVVENGKVATKEVVIGVRAGASVEVVSGLDEGEEVVARAGTFVSDGDMVTPVRGEATGAIAP